MSRGAEARRRRLRAGRGHDALRPAAAREARGGRGRAGRQLEHGAGRAAAPAGSRPFAAAICVDRDAGVGGEAGQRVAGAHDVGAEHGGRGAGDGRGGRGAAAAAAAARRRRGCDAGRLQRGGALDRASAR